MNCCYRTGDSVVMVGAGNVASHLAPALVTVGYRVTGIVSRTRQAAESLASTLPACQAATDVCSLARAYIYIICISDDAIPAVVEHIASYAPNALLIHTSGSTPLNVFGKHQRCGVIYPLQTFSLHRAVNMAEVPLFIEANNLKTLDRIRGIASRLSQRVQPLDSEARARLHVAAVFACNFPNACINVAAELMDKAEQDWRLLLPLINETIEKLDVLTPQEAQTGPAARGDTELMARQRDLLTEESWRQIYDAISHYILSRHE